ncbi:MAG: ribonuclease Z [Nanoarchaeota archaeon]|nr:ribonuclease Z [Nanoarchaeota archaeon]
MTESMKLTFLGTSDSVPSAMRNHPAILLTYGGENILIDCGEGTQRQFRKVHLNPCRITRLLITHWHADHVLGIPGLLKTLELSGYNKTLYVYGPSGTKELMRKLLDLFGFRNEYKIKIEEVSGKFFECDDFYLEAQRMTHGIACNAYSFVKKGQVRIDKAKLKKLKIESGPHLKNLKAGKDIVYGKKKYRMKDLTYSDDDKKVSFVLDTSFNKDIVPFVKNANAFVCESTFTSELEDKAKAHKHLTSVQAAQIAKAAKTGKLFLIHVSQRFSKDSDKVLSEAKKVFKNSCLPRDLDVFEV